MGDTYGGICWKWGDGKGCGLARMLKDFEKSGKLEDGMELLEVVRDVN